MIVLINPFEVPDDVSDESFLAAWQEAADYLRSQPGFVDAALHAAISPDARFRFVNVATWDTPAAFAAAVATEGFRQLSRGDRTRNYPALYAVARRVGISDGPTPALEEGVLA